jgi:hypothetical protein
MYLKYFVEAGAMAVRRVLKRDLKHVAKASGGTSSPGRDTRLLRDRCHWVRRVGVKY